MLILEEMRILKEMMILKNESFSLCKPFTWTTETNSESMIATLLNSRLKTVMLRVSVLFVVALEPLSPSSQNCLCELLHVDNVTILQSLIKIWEEIVKRWYRKGQNFDQ